MEDTPHTTSWHTGFIYVPIFLSFIEKQQVYALYLAFQEMQEFQTKEEIDWANKNMVSEDAFFKICRWSWGLQHSLKAEPFVPVH